MTTPTKFLILSDTHNFDKFTADPSSPLCQPLPKADVVLHCGDLTQVGGISAYKKALKMLCDLDAELKLVIAGNHDISLDGEYWAENMDEDDDPDEHQDAVALMTGSLAREAGVTYLTEGRHEFTLQDGVSFSIFASPYQPECGKWAFGYKRTEDRWGAIPDDVEIVMTHGPPKGILDLASKHDHVGCEYLLNGIKRSRPLMHCFGHIHEGYGAEMKVWDSPESNDPKHNDSSADSEDAEASEDDECSEVVRVTKAGTHDEGTSFTLTPGESTLMVNAAIMNDNDEPKNAPFLVELPLDI